MSHLNASDDGGRTQILERGQWWEDAGGQREIVTNITERGTVVWTGIPPKMRGRVPRDAAEFVKHWRLVPDAELTTGERQETVNVKARS
jgi:hypothetical protein